MSKETKCNLINCLTGHTCGRNIENAEEPNCVFNNPEFCGVSHTCISSSKEEPKESFKERTAKKLDNDILDKISEEPKEWEEWTIDSNSPTEKEFKQFISQVESKAYNKGFKDGEDYANDMEHSGKSNIIKP